MGEAGDGRKGRGSRLQVRPVYMRLSLSTSACQHLPPADAMHQQILGEEEQRSRRAQRENGKLQPASQNPPMPGQNAKPGLQSLVIYIFDLLGKSACERHFTAGQLMIRQLSLLRIAVTKRKCLSEGHMMCFTYSEPDIIGRNEHLLLA